MMGTYDGADREPAETAAWIVREWRDACDGVLVIAITEALKVIPATVKDLENEIARLRAKLAEVREYADDRADADCTGDPPTMVGNDWMTVVTMIDGEC